MGGRGTFARGNNVPFKYRTVERIEGVKVLEGSNHVKGLPVEAHSSGAYIQLHPDGTFKMYREFNNERYLTLEIAYHPEPKLTGHAKPVLHIHEYPRDDFKNRSTRLLTIAEYNKYKKFFKGVHEQ